MTGLQAFNTLFLPLSCAPQLKYNIDVVCEYIVKRIPIPQARAAPRLLSSAPSAQLWLFYITA